MTPKQIENESAQLKRIASELGTRSQEWLETVKEASDILSDFYSLRAQIKRLKLLAGHDATRPYPSSLETKIVSIYDAEGWLSSIKQNLLEGKKILAEKIDIVPWGKSIGGMK